MRFDLQLLNLSKELLLNNDPGQIAAPQHHHKSHLEQELLLQLLPVAQGSDNINTTRLYRLTAATVKNLSSPALASGWW